MVLTGLEPAYIAMSHCVFDSVEGFLGPSCFQPSVEVLQGDVPNYTDIEPVIRFNDVLVSQ